MADDDGGGKKWLTCGCVGCLIVVALVVLVIGVFSGSVWHSVRSEEVGEFASTPAIPRSDKRGTVTLRLSGGVFRIQPAAPGEPLRVEAKYDRRSNELEERLDTGDDGWTYDLTFERTGTTVIGWAKEMFGGTGSEIDIYLPQDAALALDMRVEQGEAQVELGGLWLTEAEFEFSMGAFGLEIDEPLREPMETLVFRGSMGGVAATGLGNASPRRLEIDCKMGGLNLDLRGEWVADSEITIRMNQGGGAVRLPRDVEIVGLQTSRTDPRPQEEIPRPTLTFSVSSDRGELEIIE